jgi:hypothetical protein
LGIFGSESIFWSKTKQNQQGISQKNLKAIRDIKKSDPNYCRNLFENVGRRVRAAANIDVLSVTKKSYQMAYMI